MPDRPRQTVLRRTILIGAIVLVLSVALILLPLVIPLGKGAKYAVAPGFVGACAAMSILLNAAIDWMRRK